MQNGQFNIPVEVVLPPDFPVTAPEVYVRPTATMIVAPNHPFVEASSGAVNTPSIVTWTYPRSNLTSCLTELSAEFGTQSPVYARPAGSAQPTPAQTPNVASFPVPNPYATTGQQPAQPTNAPARTAFGNDPYSPNPTNPAAVQNPYGTDSSNPYMTNPLRPNANSNPPARPANPSMFPGYPPAASGAGGGTYAPSNPYISARPGGTGATPGPAATFPYGSNTAALVAGQAAAGGAPNPPPPDKTSSLSEFRRAAIQSLSERLSRSIEQSEHLIDEETEKLLQQTRQVEENRKVCCALMYCACFMGEETDARQFCPPQFHSSHLRFSTTRHETISHILAHRNSLHDPQLHRSNKFFPRCRWQLVPCFAWPCFAIRFSNGRLSVQVISDACSEKKAELRSLEHNVTALSSATQALHGWLNVNEAKIASLPENVSPSDVIVPVDDLSKQSIAAQVRCLQACRCMYVGCKHECARAQLTRTCANMNHDEILRFQHCELQVILASTICTAWCCYWYDISAVESLFCPM